MSAHYRLLRWALRLLVYTGSRLFSLNIEQDGMALPTDSGDGTSSDAPPIVLSRHAGPADSFLLLHEVMSWEGRRPRIVAKAALQLIRCSTYCSTGFPTGSSCRTPHRAATRPPRLPNWHQV
ncbi:MAG: hypothetical protein IPI82_03655 [Candidatus Microthrix sp.]|nr:hypothetical protein [Candidatus Microthrix sp.]MBK7321565.1 hypothetical protein [Candidatus Microthrix sp.]